MALLTFQRATTGVRQAIFRESGNNTRFLAARLSTNPPAVTLEETNNGMFANVTLSRPEKHNCLSPDVMDGLVSTLTELSARNKKLRGVFLKADGKSFCSGGDLKHMRATADFTHAENEADAMRLSGVFDALYTFPAPVIAMVAGNTFGGGLGLISACDMAFATQACKFAFTEVKLGVIPATICPYVLAKVGAPILRRYFLTAEIFDTAAAVSMGLVNEAVADADALADTEERLKAQLMNNSPSAMRDSKDLIFNVASYGTVNSTVREWSATRLAEVRDSKDGREGMSAFIEKRKPQWQEIDWKTS
eukprot:m.283956 g.283956  ORF g.283956 m.283956 type:complete len:306 (-) comp19893_c0_seq1:240-1157(-)